MYFNVVVIPWLFAHLPRFAAVQYVAPISLSVTYCSALFISSSFFIDAYNSSPFIDTYAGAIGNNALLTAWANDYWSENDRNLYASWPRLSDQVIDNNNRNSTWWLRDGTFLRLKSLEIGYTFNNSFLNKVKLKNARIYLTGTNLLTISRFKIWDVEMGGNGLGYPIQQTTNIGINLNF